MANTFCMPMVVIMSVKKMRRILDPTKHNSYSKITIHILRVLIAQALIVMSLFTFELIYSVFTMNKYSTFNEFQSSLQTNNAELAIFTFYESLS